MAQTTTTQVSAAVSTYYDRLLLQRAKPYLIHGLAAQHRNLKRKSGNQIKFRRYSALSAATTPLTEGITPASDQLAVTDITATIDQYGSYVEITDVVDLTTEDAVITETVELQGEQIGLTFDNIVRDILSSTASATNASNGSNGNTPTEITKADIDSEVKTLRGNNALYLTQLIPAGGGQGTVPVGPCYLGLCDVDIVDDLNGLSNFIFPEEYGNRGAIMEMEEGTTGKVRWFTSSEGKATSESPVQYHCFIIGKNAYAETELEGGSAQTIIKAFGSGGTSDPLDQRSTVGKVSAHVKPNLIDLEAYGVSYGDKGEPEWGAERLSGWAA